MRTWIDSFVRRPSVLVIGLGIVAATVLLGSQGEASRTDWMAFGLIISVVMVMAVGLALNLAGRDPDAELRARLVAGDDPTALALLTRWLRRSAHFRFVGGLSGFVLGFGFADANLVPMVIGTLAGVAAGGALAEVHALRRPGTGSRVADLTSRRLADYANRVDLGALFLVGVMATGLVVWAVVGSGSSPDGVPALAAVAVVLIVAAGQRQVVVRPRPALEPGLRQADDLMRRLAATQGFARPGIALAITLVAVAIGSTGAPAIVVAPLWLAALAWYWASRQSDTNLRAAIR